MLADAPGANSLIVKADFVRRNTDVIARHVHSTRFKGRLDEHAAPTDRYDAPFAFVGFQQVRSSLLQLQLGRVLRPAEKVLTQSSFE
jgi:hypothetical protein